MADHRCCTDYTRWRALRAGAAVAGRGLPAIEAGTPVPAGTGMDRRSFLLRSSALALSVHGAGRLAPQAFEEGIAMAADGSPQRVLVSVFLSGGIDALSVLAPVESSRYQELRPTLKVSDGTRLSAEVSVNWQNTDASEHDLWATPLAGTAGTAQQIIAATPTTESRSTATRR